MASIIGSILRAASRKDGEKLNILTFPTHERYETNLCKTGHNFYGFRGPNIKDWNTIYAPVPKNYFLLEPQKEPLLELDFDLILSQNKFGQYPVAKHFSKLYHCPLVTLEHTLPDKNWGKETIESFGNMTGEIDVYISDYSVGAWGRKSGAIIRHGIETDIFSPDETNRKNHLLSVVNDWPNRDWCCGFNLWKQVSKNLPVYVVGNSPGFSLPAKNINELVMFYRASRIFLNTSLISPIPMALLEAMACGCAIVTTATCMIPEVIVNGVNGFISNNPAELTEFCNILLKNEKLATKLGKAARQTILDRFSIDMFVDNWNNIFNHVSDNVFVKE